MISRHAKLVIEPADSPESMRSALVSFSTGRLPAILESSRVTKPYGRYSVLACDPAAVVTIEANPEAASEADCEVDVVAVLQKAFSKWPVLDTSSSKLPVCVGWIGYLSYEAGLPLVGLPSRSFQRVSRPLEPNSTAQNTITDANLAQFCLYDHAAVYDAWLDRWYAVAVDWPANTPKPRPRAANQLAAVHDLLNRDLHNHYNNMHEVQMPIADSVAAIPSGSASQGFVDDVPVTNILPSDIPFDKRHDLLSSCARRSALPSPLTKGGLRGVSSPVSAKTVSIKPNGAALQFPTNESDEPTISASMSRERYFQQFAKAMSYIEGGDIYEVNLAIRFDARTTLSPIEQYLRLRESSPSTNAAFLPWNDYAILSTSPELFLELRDGQVITRPIKGTRARADDFVDDESCKQDLAGSEKDRAELNMIVDLMRNDLGRVCEYGSVRVLEAATVESLPTVYQQVATIEGRLSRRFAWPDLLRAAFPGGSITGAPKIRAMQIIEQLEPVDREVYCGSIGIIGLDGSMALSIAIRTMVQQGDRVKFWAGGAIVADSVPQSEYDEILTKTVGLRRALVGSPTMACATAQYNKKETVI